ncbi:MAG: polysaccharide biosynthesis protein [Bacteroidetes bacterium]|nr:polysaccharide biosynthesis protein [Bacteroidota bacterium]
MGVSLFTVRVVLDVLGTVDYGLYNVVGGIVSMFSFLSGTMASASQRFFAFELGRNNYEQLKKTFSMTMTIYVIIAAVILILSETVGLWFLNYKMNIPPERLDAAQWVYQFSILSFMMTMFTIPYNAAIIAQEKMKMYAYVSIIEVILRLLIVYFLLESSYDKLKVYAILMFIVTTLITLIYRMYTIRKFKIYRYSFYWNSDLFKEIMSYSGWNLFGALASVSNNQGINILLNIFFGPVVNAARGIAFQVNNAVTQFVQNFMTASRPQIIKYYASGEKQQMLRLAFQSSKYAYLLLFIVSLPIFLETKYVFTLWLKQIPDHAILFTRLTIIATFFNALSLSLMTVVQATGKIKKYQSIIGGIMLLNLPISYLFLKLNFSPEIVFYIFIFTSAISLALRLVLLKEIVDFSIKNYLKEVIAPVLFISLIAYIIPLLLQGILKFGFIRFLLISVSSVLVTLIATFFLGLSKKEKSYFFSMINKMKKSRGI